MFHSKVPNSMPFIKAAQVPEPRKSVVAGDFVDQAGLGEAIYGDGLPDSSHDPRKEQEPGVGLPVKVGGHSDCNEQEEEGSGQWAAGLACRWMAMAPRA